MKRLSLLLLLVLSASLSVGQIRIVELSTNSESFKNVNKPQISVAPVVSGDVYVGEQLNTTLGTWLFNPLTYAYQWQANGVDISSATNSFYIVQAADDGASITCNVTATNPGGATTASSNSVTAAWSPKSFGSSLVYFINPAKLKTMFVEGTASTAQVTQASVSSTAGFIYDESPNALTSRSTSVVLAPTVGNTTMGTLDFTGSTTHTQLFDTQTFFTPCYNSTPLFTSLSWTKWNTDGTDNGQIIGNTTTSTVNAGFIIYRNSANKIVFLTVDNAAIKTNVTTTGTILTTHGFVALKVQVNGTGAGALTIEAYSLTSNSTIFSESFTMTGGVGAGTAASYNCTLGGRADLAGTLFMKGKLGPNCMVNRTVTGTEWTKFKAYQPVSVTSEMFPVMEWEYDMNVSNRVYQESTFTTPSANGDVVKGIKNNTVSNFGDLNRNLTATNGGTYRTAYQNGYASVEFDGSATNFSFPANYSFEKGGKYLIVTVIKNQNVSLGSEYTKGGGYIVVTGTGYGSGGPTIAWHSASGESLSVHTQSHNDEFTVAGQVRNGTAATLHSSTLNVSGTFTNGYTVNVIGQESITPWWTNAQILYMAKFNGAESLTDTNIRKALLNTKYAIPHTP